MFKIVYCIFWSIGLYSKLSMIILKIDENVKSNYKIQNKTKNYPSFCL